MKYILLFFALLTATLTLTAQPAAPWSLKALTYRGVISAKHNKGKTPDMVLFDVGQAPDQLKEGDRADVICAEGKRYSFEFIKSEPAPGTDRIRVHMKPIGDISQLLNENEYVYYIVPAGTVLSSGIQANNNPMDMIAEVDPPLNLTPALFAQFNGAEWQGGLLPNSAVFYEKGNVAADPSGKPVLLLTFKAVNAPDNRKFTVVIRDFKGMGRYPKAEILLSGSETGDPTLVQKQGYQDNPSFREQKTDFSFEVTDWHRPSETQAFLSSAFSGKLKGLDGAPDMVISHGYCLKLEVVIYTE